MEFVATFNFYKLYLLFVHALLFRIQSTVMIRCPACTKSSDVFIECIKTCYKTKMFNGNLNFPPMVHPIVTFLPTKFSVLCSRSRQIYIADIMLT